MTAAVRHVLCPVDFSDASRAALRQAAAVAEYFGARLTVLTVDDPLLAQVAAHADLALPDETEQELRRFCADVLTQSKDVGSEMGSLKSTLEKIYQTQVKPKLDA